MERRLAPILIADMAAYSRPLEQDEQGAAARQKAHRSDLIDEWAAVSSIRLKDPRDPGLAPEFAQAEPARKPAT